ncbi:MAG: hypothetical protein WKF41_03800 [Gaiellaceae bacterium]
MAQMEADHRPGPLDEAAHGIDEPPLDHAAAVSIAPAHRTFERAFLAVVLVTQIPWLVFLAYLLQKGLRAAIAL